MSSTHPFPFTIGKSGLPSQAHHDGSTRPHTITAPHGPSIFTDSKRDVWGNRKRPFMVNDGPDLGVQTPSFGASPVLSSQKKPSPVAELLPANPAAKKQVKTVPKPLMEAQPSSTATRSTPDGPAKDSSPILVDEDLSCESRITFGGKNAEEKHAKDDRKPPETQPTGSQSFISLDGDTFLAATQLPTPFPQPQSEPRLGEVSADDIAEVSPNELSYLFTGQPAKPPLRSSPPLPPGFQDMSGRNVPPEEPTLPSCKKVKTSEMTETPAGPVTAPVANDAQPDKDTSHDHPGPEEAPKDTSVTAPPSSQVPPPSSEVSWSVQKDWASVARGIKFFSGRIEDGKFEGKCCVHFADGLEFEGEFVGGRRNGPGILRWPDGTSAEGEYRDDSPSGYFRAVRDGQELTGKLRNETFSEYRVKEFPQFVLRGEIGPAGTYEGSAVLESKGLQVAVNMVADNVDTTTPAQVMLSDGEEALEGAFTLTEDYELGLLEAEGGRVLVDFREGRLRRFLPK